MKIINKSSIFSMVICGLCVLRYLTPIAQETPSPIKEIPNLVLMFMYVGLKIGNWEQQLIDRKEKP